MSVALALVQQGTALAALTPPAVPPNLAVPAGNVLSLVGHARGYQVYECHAVNNGYAWALLYAYAGLTDDSGNYVAQHYPGPTWRGPDNSYVVATRIASAPAPSGTTIPWLLLQATSNSGPPGGLFTNTTYIQRINTTGGLAPAGGCDEAHVGAVAAVYYTADYYFYKAG
jgi:hypothetical protein